MRKRETTAAGSAGTAAYTPVPRSGNQYEIASGPLRAVVTEVGATLRALSVDGRPVLWGFEPDELPPAANGQLLMPWPNRVAGGRYTFDGTEYHLDISEPKLNNAIHGLVRAAPWRPVGRTGDTLTLGARLFPQHGYPHVLDLAVTYQVAADALTVAVACRNAGSEPAPYGVGAHPYLRPAEGPVDGWTLRLPADRRLRVDDRMLPVEEEKVDGTPYDFREARPIGDLSLDTAFTGLHRDDDGAARVRLSAEDGLTLTMELGAGLDWLQLFTGDGLGPGRRRGALAVEPMSCPPDAFNSGTGLIRLEPGEAITHSWSVHIS